MKERYILLLALIFAINGYPQICVYAVDDVSPSTVKSIEQRIVSFYKGYMESENSSVWESEYLTKGMMEKCKRVSPIMDVNAIYRAQDYTDYALQTLSCRHLKGLWYEVSFQMHKQAEAVSIPVRMDGNSEEARICYVVPLWGDRNYGDWLFRTYPEKITNKNPDSFVRTFYNQYTDLYVAMPDTLEQGLAHLRDMYCTTALNTEYDSLRQCYKGDGITTYDVLVGNSDFDAFWKPSLNVEKKDSLQYEISYKVDASWEQYVCVYLKECEGTYKIDSVAVDFKY